MQFLLEKLEQRAALRQSLRVFIKRVYDARQAGHAKDRNRAGDVACGVRQSLPDDKWGERVHAVVALIEGETATEAEVIAWCGESLARFKQPRGVTFVAADAIPRTATGKIQHGQVKEKFLNGSFETPNQKEATE